MEQRSRSTRHGCSENRTNCLNDRLLGPVSSRKTRKSLLSAREKQLRLHWQNARGEFQVRMERLQSSEFRTKPLNQRSRASASTSTGLNTCLRSHVQPKRPPPLLFPVSSVLSLPPAHPV